MARALPDGLPPPAYCIHPPLHSQDRKRTHHLEPKLTWAHWLSLPRPRTLSEQLSIRWNAYIEPHCAKGRAHPSRRAPLTRSVWTYAVCLE